ncbi:PopZ family protein [Bosea sp. (in: a-proteobacteria)]|uniref:PopZ family protein n=1 Tax=Bosea sp. (in: a-proteobacteria) TaxID=1871050 RepID=UPI002FCA723A
MSAQPKPNEPSMEEILASIRRIIADDEKPPEAEPVALVPEPAPEPAPLPEAAADAEDDVLDLGAEASRVDEAVAIAASDDIDFAEPSAAAPEPEPDPVRPEPVQPEPQPIAFVPPPLQAAPSAPLPPPPLDMATLISDQTGAAVHNAFGALANTVLSNNARTLEDLVKDMLKPMLKTWLDDNLPGMVERLVRAEIERVARGGRN